MRTFQFRMSTLLRLRVAERDQRRSDLAKALRAEVLLREEQERLLAEQRGVIEQARRHKAPGAANVDLLLQTHRYEVVLAARARELVAKLAQIAAESERRRQALVEADRQVRVLEKLRARQALNHRREQDRQETKQLDEMALIGYVRSREEPR